MVLPQPGFHQALREATRRSGTLLVIDETHTLSSGLGGYSASHGLEPDLFVCGKAIAGGFPCAVYGFTAAVEQQMQRVLAARAGGHSGMGTTLAGNPLAIECLAAALTSLQTAERYGRMEAGAALLETRLQALFAARDLSWHVSRVGARVEFGFGPAPRNGSEAEAAMRPEFEHALHLFLLNRGVLVTPFHNMMLVSPVTSAAQVERLVAGLGEALDQLELRARAA
jgi:glutamate-1-semialdehyde 2,1-aminomutase